MPAPLHGFPSPLASPRPPRIAGAAPTRGCLLPLDGPSLPLPSVVGLIPARASSNAAPVRGSLLPR
eukprot:1948474-Heterocapsa_arctica.AAC.1